jgi:hypothetical protein
MLITVKNIYKKEEVFEVSIDEKVSTLAELVKERFDYMNNVKLIYAGQILNLDNPISTYMNESSYGFMVCFEEKPKKIQEISIPISDNVNDTETTETTETIVNTTDSEVKTMNAILFAFFRFIQSHESLNYIYFTNPGVMNKMFKDKKFDTLIQQLIENKDKILDGLENNRHTQIDLTLDRELVNSIMMNLFFNNNNN